MIAAAEEFARRIERHVTHVGTLQSHGTWVWSTHIAFGDIRESTHDGPGALWGELIFIELLDKVPADLLAPILFDPSPFVLEEGGHVWEAEARVGVGGTCGSRRHLIGGYPRR